MSQAKSGYRVQKLAAQAGESLSQRRSRTVDYAALRRENIARTRAAESARDRRTRTIRGELTWLMHDVCSTPYAVTYED